MRPLRAWIDALFAGQRPRRVLFRVDAGRIRGLSFGHLVRCQVLERNCRALFGSRSLFVMRDRPEGIAAARENDQPVATIDAEEATGDQTPVLSRQCRRFEPDWVVVDLPYGRFPPGCFERLHARGAQSLFVDDFRFFNPGADVYLNSSILAPERVAVRPGQERCVFLGPRHFICDPPEPLPQQRYEGLVNGLLTFGGSDPTGQTVKALECLLQRDWPCTLWRLALGPGFAQASRVQGMLEGRKDFELHVNPPSLWPLLAGCDLAVSAGGRTLYELCLLKKPILAVATSTVEAEAARAFKRRRLIADALSGWDQERFVDALARLWATVQASPAD